MAATDATDLVPPAQLERWRRELEKSERRSASLKNLIEAAQALLPSDQPPKSPSRAATPRRRRKTTVRRGKRRTTVVHASASPPASQPSATRARLSKPARGEWNPLISMIALTSDRPVSYPEAREEIRRLRPDLAEHMDQTEFKGFYHAIRRMTKSGEIVSYKGHIFAPDLFRKFKADLDAGLINDIDVPNAAYRSPVGEAILAILERRRAGAESGHLIWELQKDPELAAVITRNKSHAYNVIKRLKDRGQIINRGKRYFHASPRTEAPPNAEGASNRTGEGGASPNPGQGSLLG